MKNSQSAQSVAIIKDYEQNTSLIETLDCATNRDRVLNASNIDNQDNKMQIVPHSPFELSELKAPVQRVNN